jgi:hypothetical protein
MTGRGVHFAVDAGPAALDSREGRAKQRLSPGAQVIVGVFVHVERERLGVFVRVSDGESAVGPLDQQQLRPLRGGGLRRELPPSRQVIGGVVAQRVAVGQRRGDRFSASRIRVMPRAT